MIVDMLTKPLAKDRHQASTKAMGLEAFGYLQIESVDCRAFGPVYTMDHEVVPW